MAVLLEDKVPVAPEEGLDVVAPVEEEDGFDTVAPEAEEEEDVHP